MAEISRSALFGRLDAQALKGIETATGFCKMRGNPYVELVHWLHVLLQDSRNDLASIRSAFNLIDAQLARDVVAQLDQLPRGATAISDFSPQIEEAIEKGWLYASLQFSASRVRTGHLLYGMLRTPTLRNALFQISSEFRKVGPDRLGEEFEAIVQSSAEQTQRDSGPIAAAGGEGDAVGANVPHSGEGEALARYSIDLTAKARAGEIDRIVGRDPEIRQVVDILLRRRQNNPILIGEAGVGKTAVAEGFARRIADGDVPPALANVVLRSLDIGLMQAGASVKGEFEKRLRQVIDEVEQSPVPVILFIDEAHTLIGAGGQAGTGDAANLLKPALARGRLRTVAATTYAEYRTYFEKDPALTRRFQPVDVGEPETPAAIAMIRSVAPAMEAHHQVVVLDEAVAAAVTLSQRYVPARQLPDKAVSLLDTACARVAVSQHATPAQVEDRRRRVELLMVEDEIVAREQAGQYRADDRLARIAEELTEARAAQAEIEAKWIREKDALEGVRAARDALTAAREQDGSGEAEAAALDTALAAMRDAHGDQPMVFGVVDQDAVAAVVGDWTGIPVGRMVKDEIRSVLAIGEQLKTRVVGQDHAMDAIAKRVQTSRAKLDNPGKPVGVFMLCGPSGVGKTETAHALAELLYSGDDSMIVINMSEFQEAHTVSTLKGAPAGYVGYGQGGVLTEAVRRRPYSVVLLDEVEKAHPDVHEMFFQVFDKGFMNDSEGRFIDFKNTLILLTSNVGTDLITQLSEDEETRPDADALGQALRPDLLKVFPPALLGRLVVLPYYPLSPTMLAGIVRLQLERVRRRIADNHGIRFEYGQDVVDLIVSRCNEVASGGRIIDAILTNTMLPEMSIALLGRQMSGEMTTTIAVGVDANGFTYRFQGDADEAVASLKAPPAIARMDAGA